MSGSSYWLTMDDGAEIHYKKWDHKEPKAIIQLAHGMAEHIGRYEEFAHYLVENGYAVYGHDHRGHGLTGEKEGTLGFLAEENGFDRAVKDVHKINELIRKEFPQIPIILFGHSFGSFLVRRYIQIHPYTIKGVILSGTTGNPGLLGKVGKILAKREVRRKGGRAPSPFMNLLIFGAYSKVVPNAKTEFDWLTRDDQLVEEYIQDPLCGFICSSSFFVDLLTGLEKIHKEEYIQAIPKDLPILVFAGEEDPVGKKAKAVKKVIEQYKRNGLTSIEFKFYKDGRHEMLNELNKEEVYELIKKWLQKQFF